MTESVEPNQDGRQSKTDVDEDNGDDWEDVS